MSFEKSKQYKEALEVYRQETYQTALNPTNVIVTQGGTIFDTVYLFYNQEIIEDILQILIEEYKKRNEDDEITVLNLNLGYDTPKLVNYTFMGKTYKAILLWYDKETRFIPKEFLNK